MFCSTTPPSARGPLRSLEPLSGLWAVRRSGLKAAVDAWATASEPQRQHLRTRWGDISEWNVSAVTNFSGLFEGGQKAMSGNRSCADSDQVSIEFMDLM